MGMPLELNTMIVTKGNERRIEENDFILERKITAYIRLKFRLK